MKRLFAYVRYIDNLLERDDLNWEEEVKKHKEHMAIFQHDMLVCTVEMVAIVVSCFMYLWSAPTYELFLFSGAAIIVVFVLSLIMELKLGKIYSQYDEMMKKLGEAFDMPKKK